MHVASVLIVKMAIAFFQGCRSAPTCGPEKYLDKNKCCEMCPKGEKRVSGCEIPVCEPCPDGEYMSESNPKTSCIVKSYCDPNLNFVYKSPGSRFENSQCMCKEGTHCSSEDCNTCNANTECEKGHGVKAAATEQKDTECEACPKNYYSNITSAKEPCIPWTSCAPGLIVKTEGTAISDVVCGPVERDGRFTMAVWITVGVLAVLVAVGFAVYTQRAKLTEHCKKHKGQCHTVPAPAKEVNNPVEMDDQQLLQEPEPKSPTEETLSDGKRLVTQEVGKDSHMPEQDSQDSRF
ncbi:tumor necrosis factor receptor superfamily member 5-like [Polyodon spathula]|uniref:tumor necrosis factor receptor superfamily member 5-like n=1 Tax=Polyodon spathula TaxID=7913 RepID=UPI001B7E780C|nr:tumor necrosis factor receptor superfamily member 5-like [Polyodon spathula]